MISFAKEKLEWLNKAVKNTNTSIKKKIVSRYSNPSSEIDNSNTVINKSRNTDVNVLLNRVRLNQKNESRKKLYFSAAASTGLILFGFIIF